MSQHTETTARIVFKAYGDKGIEDVKEYVLDVLEYAMAKGIYINYAFEDKKNFPGVTLSIEDVHTRIMRMEITESIINSISHVVKPPKKVVEYMKRQRGEKYGKV